MSRFIFVPVMVSALLLGGAAAGAAEGSRVRLETTMGNITLALETEKAPRSVENFLGYVRSGFYDGTLFHRVIGGFMIQGGGFTEDFDRKGTEAPIPNEANNGLKNLRGTLSMARTSDPHSATSQFFINVADNQALDHKGTTNRGWGYAVFGRVVEGMEVVDQIRNVPTTMKGAYRDVPVTPVVITRAVVESAKSTE
jgi:cyclophilin family peptidyl-prolyl cis-trans isomerase